MKSLWNDGHAAQFVGDLAQRVYTSRLLGRDASLVLDGGGTTSVKVREINVFGEEEDVLYIKGGDCRLEAIEAEGFSPCRLTHLLRLSGLTTLADAQLKAELTLCVTRPATPAPPADALLHAILPNKFVDHTRPDALISIMNTPNGTERVRELYGDRVVIAPYVKPGIKLARQCRELLQEHTTGRTVGMIVMNHGLFTFGETAKISYERTIELVDRAEHYLGEQDAWLIEWPAPAEPPHTQCLEIAALRRAVSLAAGAPSILAVHGDPRSLGFARRPGVSELSQRGAAIPDHVTRTKRVPLIGRDVGAFCRAYADYVQAHAAKRKLCTVDHAPRVILDPELGLCAAGRTADDAAIAEGIYRHTMDIMLRAERLGGWRPLPVRDFFEAEHEAMEHAKLEKGRHEPALRGEIALVTGAASGIGRACVESLLNHGAAVAAVDVAPLVIQLRTRKDYLGIQCDLTSEQEIGAALEQTVRTFGGLDMLILNAGIFPSSCPIATLSSETWRRAMSVNLDPNLVLMRECHPLLKAAPRGGRVAIIGSKNVAAPGPGAAAYSASKAALQQLARVAALEWGDDQIRVNTVHPNAVFDTGIWTQEALAARAAAYGMTSQEYKTNNVLKTEITSRDVAELVAELCGPTFAKTTGAQIPVDGGNVRVI